MELCLIRHGETEAPGRGKDAERRLTEGGRAVLGRVAAGLATFGIEAEVIFSSPFTRAVETAEILAAGMGGTGKAAVETTPLLLPGADPRGIVRLIERGAGAVALVGHQPFVGTCAGWLLGLDPARIRFAPGTVARIELEGTRIGRTGRLLALWPPYTFTGMPAARAEGPRFDLD